MIKICENLCDPSNPCAIRYSTHKIAKISGHNLIRNIPAARTELHRQTGGHHGEGKALMHLLGVTHLGHVEMAADHGQRRLDFQQSQAAAWAQAWA